MATGESDFQKLLQDAPMAPNENTVTVVGVLGRTPDATHFMLTLPDGRMEKLEVSAVKSAKALAGSVGQSLVELELDAKRVPEAVRTPGHTHHTADQHHTGLYDYVTFAEGLKLPGETAFAGHVSVAGPGLGSGIGATGVPPATPFIAAMPHQAPPATMAALMQGVPEPLSYVYRKPPWADPSTPVSDATAPYPWNPHYRDAPIY